METPFRRSRSVQTWAALAETAATRSSHSGSQLHTEDAGMSASVTTVPPSPTSDEGDHSPESRWDAFPISGYSDRAAALS